MRNLGQLERQIQANFIYRDASRNSKGSRLLALAINPQCDPRLLLKKKPCVRDKQLWVLKDRTVTRVGVKHQCRIRDVPLQNERVDGWHHDVVSTVHDKDRLADVLDPRVSPGLRDHSPEGD